MLSNVEPDPMALHILATYIPVESCERFISWVARQAWFKRKWPLFDVTALRPKQRCACLLQA